MLFYFISLFMLLFKWQRLIYILITLEFLMLSLFLYLSLSISSMMFFYFMCFSVMSSILGVIMMVTSMKTFGSDMSLI
uniref:NADH dehydrogenase subunit 4L n=1 Tax=Allodiplogaster sudhausi TaxID=2761625 RepID=A0A0U3BJI1_9BILA|nr:NADH dehydrogenase subunit 4L [Allodiplogaster sudhausi]ALT06541.1 NADH dehydrogenase subunit 4L [Allodiplogaster sudhausi]